MWSTNCCLGARSPSSTACARSNWSVMPSLQRQRIGGDKAKPVESAGELVPLSQLPVMRQSPVNLGFLSRACAQCQARDARVEVAEPASLNHLPVERPLVLAATTSGRLEPGRRVRSASASANQSSRGLLVRRADPRPVQCEAPLVRRPCLDVGRLEWGGNVGS